ncbi:DUF2637 domain-containing protein [Planosporangium sp. 12N6]|uniref:DUF2637 domain-containing protein n=1 Tax=Planosporangium spinosum TaxID=3402278 RepID=UPI003CE82FE9
MAIRLTVAGLAGAAGAISFAHMAALAAEHGQLGWKPTAFPISVDWAISRSARRGVLHQVWTTCT